MTNIGINESKPRILVSGHLPPPMGGVGTFYQALLNSSLPNQVNFCFVQTSSQNRTLAQTGKFSFSNLISAIADCCRFTKAVMTHRPQLTHIATAVGLSFSKHSVCVIIARLFGSRVLIHPHCSISALYTDRPRWWQWYFRRIIRLTNGVVALSTEWDQLDRIVPGCPVYYLPNAIDLTPYYAVGQERNLAGIKPSQLKVLYLGYLGKEKGSFDLVQAAKEISIKKLPILINLVGEELEPGEAGQLRNQIDQDRLENVVILHPPVMGPEKIYFLREADIFIYPSYSEGLPIAIIEALACGLPIIASRVGGIPDLVVDEVNGLLVDAGRADQLVNAIEYLRSKPDLRSSMQLYNSRSAMEKYDIEKLVPRLVKIYQTALMGI
jgi:glycosyltransferase involved in cell wall biosynthesis